MTEPQTTKGKKMKHKVSNGKRKLEWCSNRGDFSISIQASMIDLMPEEQRSLLDDMASRIMVVVEGALYQAGPFISRIKVTK